MNNMTTGVVGYLLQSKASNAIERGTGFDTALQTSTSSSREALKGVCPRTSPVFQVLDVLEAFLSFHGFIYLRLDGSTRVEQRQLLMERFNNNTKYFAFILSTRSGGVGINLTGADTVIFYDSDWNPTMDAQAQDRQVVNNGNNIITMAWP